MYYEEYLYHHGVKGQRWGVRRFQNKDGTLIHPKRKVKKQKENQEAKETNKKKPQNMSAEELKRETERLKALKEYKNLYAEVNGKQIGAGKKFVKDILGSIAKQAITNVGTDAAKWVLKQGFKKILNDEEKYNEMFPSKKKKGGGGNNNNNDDD